MEYYFIGIKGSGMASMAQILHDMGHKVSGSDIQQHIFTQDLLEKKNIPIYDFNSSNLTEDMIIIKGNSFDEQHPEVIKAKELNLTIKSYVELLSELITEYYSICIAGTHGKTTTTGLVQHLFSGKEATGYLIGDGTGYLSKDSINFIVESCEYQDNFLNYYPKAILINNIELDHVDYFKSMEQYLQSFKEFSTHASEFVVLNGDDVNMKIPHQANHYYFGTKDNAHFKAEHINYDESGVEFDLIINIDNEVKKAHFKLNLYGSHMLYNSLAAIALYYLKTNDTDFQYIERRLNTFQGVARRFEVKELGSNIIIDDYAHHPTAIKLMIETVRQKYPDKKIVAFFKPDRYSRIYEFGQQIGQELNLADEAYLFEFPVTSIKEPGIEIDMNFVLKSMKHGIIIDEDLNSVQRFKDYQNSVFLFMSSKNVYDYEELLEKSLKYANDCAS